MIKLIRICLKNQMPPFQIRKGGGIMTKKDTRKLISKLFIIIFILVIILVIKVFTRLYYKIKTSECDFRHILFLLYEETLHYIHSNTNKTKDQSLTQN